MAELALQKLRPDQTFRLRGFDRRGAAAFLTESSPTGVKLQGVFRGMDDFAVVVIHDMDDTLSHPLVKALPDSSLANLTLEFDLTVAGIQPVDSAKFSWIDWKHLDCIRVSGEPVQISLWDNARLQSGTFTAASGEFEFVGSGTMQQYDRVTLWYGNIAFDYIVPSPVPATVAEVMDALAAQINGYDWVGTSPSYGLLAEVASSSTMRLTAAQFGRVNVAGTSVTWVSGHKFQGLSAGQVFRVGGSSYTIDSVASLTSLTLTASAGTLSNVDYLSPRGGYDGNMIAVKERHKNTNLRAYAVGSSPEQYFVKFSGGSSDVTWRITLPFTSLGVDNLRQAWLTFAPRLPDSSDYADTEWTATISGWNVTGSGSRELKVAHPTKSVRVGSRDLQAKYTGTWAEQDSNLYYHGFARVTNTPGSTVTVVYHCRETHDLMLGSAFYSDRGVISVSLDGDTATTLDCFVKVEPPVISRRLLRSSVAAGRHSLTITLTSSQHVAGGAWDINSTGRWFAFDYLEAAVRSDVQDPEVVYTDVSAAIDQDTDAGYKPPVQWLMTGLDRQGLQGPVNLYVGVFFWNQRKRGSDAVFKSWTITFGGTWASGDAVFVDVGGLVLGKSVFPADDSDSIAQHFCFFINQTFVGVWAECSGPVLTVHVRTPGWTFSKSVSVTSTAGIATESGDLSLGIEGTWEIDDTLAEVVNWPTRKWLEDIAQECAARSRRLTLAYSMELVNPPDNPGAGKIYASRYLSGSPVLTDTGFSNLRSTHCAFSPTMADYQKKVYLKSAQILAAAGLVPWLQFGEFLWWFFSEKSRKPLAVANATPVEIYFDFPHGLTNGEFLLNAGYKGCTAANGRHSVVVINPYQVALVGTVGNGAWVTGSGETRTGSMGYYDAYTQAQASAVLGRPLARFNTQDDDPAVNSGADVALLQALLKAHIDTIRTHVLATVPTAKFEWLFPYDVNFPDVFWSNALPYPQGGRMNSTVNLPPAYLTYAGSGLDAILVEALSWGSFYRHWANAMRSIEWAQTAPRNWPKSRTAYLIPTFNGGCFWDREYLHARQHGHNNLLWWAYDHRCSMSLPARLPESQGLSSFEASGGA